MTRTGRLSLYIRTLLCFIIIVSSVLVSGVNAKRVSSGHHHTSYGSHSSHSSYPAHTGLSGSSVTQHIYKPTYTKPSYSYPTNSLSGGTSGHSYPNSNSLSGSGTRSGSASYPASNGLSGNTASGGYNPYGGSQIHSYPSPNAGRPASASYPSSNGLSGNTASGTRYPSGGAASYPSSHGLSGNTASGNRYPSSGSNYPSNTHYNNGWQTNQNVHHHTNSRTVIHHHHHYDYSPPRTIYYTSSYGVSPISYPVYTGIPPTYVYEYRSSGNKYSTLLAGLALYNLGRMSANPHYYDYHRNYRPQPNERCIFGVHYNTGAVEEMAIECQAITYFIYESTQVPQVQPQTQTHIVNQTTITTQTMLPNGTLINPISTQTQIVNGVVVPNTQQVLAGNGQIVNTQQTNTITTTTTQVATVNDPRLLGNPVQVNPNMNCYVRRTTLGSNIQKPVPCDLLQQYAASSLRRNAGVMVKSYFTGIMIAVVLLVY